MIIPSILRTADGRSYEVRFPFDRDVVEGIKQLVPAHSRRFDPDEKCWYVAPAFRDVVYELLADTFLEVETDSERTSTYTPPTNTTPATSYTVLHLLPSAPVEVAEAAYRTLSRLHHPDHGGDTAKMQALNEAIAIIRRRVAS